MDPGYIGLSLKQRQWIGIEAGDVVAVEHLPSPPHREAPIFIHAMEIEIDFLQKGYRNGKGYLSIDMVSTFIDGFRGIVMTVGRSILFLFEGEELQGKIKSVALRGTSSAPPTRNDTGIVFAGTDVIFIEATGSTIKVTPSVRSPVPASIFAAGVQTINIYGGTFNTLLSSCACATATRCLENDNSSCQCAADNPGKTSEKGIAYKLLTWLAAGGKKDKVNYQVPSPARGGSSTGNSA